MKKITKKKLLIICLGLLVTNVLLTLALAKLDNSTYRHLDGQEIEPHSSELVGTIVFGHAISIPIFCFLIGLILAIFVYRTVPYSRRIVRSFLFTLLTVYGLFAIMGIFKVLSFL